MDDIDGEVRKDYRILILGNRCVGKTCLVNQLCYERFVERYRPTIDTPYKYNLKFNNTIYELDILDSAGMDEYSFIPEDFSANLYDAFVFVYAIDNLESFNIVKQIKDKLEQKRGASLASSQKAVILVGNKTDLNGNRQVTEDEGKQIAKSWNAQFLEVSAKEGSKVRGVFEGTIKKIEALINGTGREAKEKKCSIQ
ncbi:unnamed protein product [Oikopleura dioica]|uniref:Small monomeric GTPase n=1 Tax=Oikopleura dioica TaxID=34765 RepID=E4XGP5_OIKDI|nr:unnamed protein product [Oikopleura dioica]